MKTHRWVFGGSKAECSGKILNIRKLFKPVAEKLGVRAHHWRFGNMPQVSGVSEGEVANIFAHIRELQRANGIN